MPYTFNTISDSLVLSGKKSGLNSGDILGSIVFAASVWCKLSPSKYHIGDDYTLRHFKELKEIDVYMPLSQFKKLKKLKIGKFPETKNKVPDDKVMFVLHIDGVGKIEFHTQSRATAKPSSKWNHGTIKSKLDFDVHGNGCMGPELFMKYCIESDTPRDKKNLEILHKGLSEEKKGYHFGLDEASIKSILRKIKKHLA